jgi:hypothetical protein
VVRSTLKLKRSSARLVLRPFSSPFSHLSAAKFLSGKSVVLKYVSFKMAVVSTAAPVSVPVPAPTSASVPVPTHSKMALPLQPVQTHTHLPATFAAHDHDGYDNDK